MFSKRVQTSEWRRQILAVYAGEKARLDKHEKVFAVKPNYCLRVVKLVLYPLRITLPSLSWL